MSTSARPCVALLRSASLLGALVVLGCPMRIRRDMLLHAKDDRAPTVVITSPENGSSYRSTVTVAGTVSDDAREPGDGLGSVLRLSFEVVGTAHAAEVEVADGAFAFSFSTLDLVGDRELALQAEDWNGNIARVVLELVDDTSGPALSVTTPENESEYRRIVRVEGMVSDSPDRPGQTGEVASLSYEVPDAGIVEAIPFGVDGAFSFEFSTEGLSSDLDVRISATDIHGDASQRNLTLLDDEIGPFMTMSSPGDQSFYAATVVASGNVCNCQSEPGCTGEVMALSYEVLGTAVKGALEFDSEGDFAFSFPTSGFTGTRTLCLRAQDWNLNVTEELLTLLDGGSDIPSFTVQSDNHAIVLEWDPVPLATSYSIHYVPYGGIPSEANGIHLHDVSSPYRLEGLENGVLHVFLLQAHCSPGEDSYSSLERTIPLSPLMLRPKVAGECGGVTVRWAQIPGADTYEVLRSQTFDGQYTDISGSIAGTEFVDRGAATGQMYYYRVRPSVGGCAPSASAWGSPVPYEPHRLRYEGVGFEFAITDSTPRCVAVRDSRVYLSCMTQFLWNPPACGMSIYDLSTLGICLGSTVVVNGSVPAQDMAVQGDYVYMAGPGDLWVVSIAEETEPAYVGLCSGFTDIQGVAVHGTWAYVADGAGGLRFVDITEPTNPFLDGEAVATTSARKVATDGTYAYVADGADGLRVVDLETRTIPKTLTLPADALSVAISGDRALVAMGTAGLAVIDITDPADASLAGTVIGLFSSPRRRIS